MPELPEIGSRLQELRKSRGMSLQELARRAGVSKAMLSQIKKNKVNPTLGLVWRVARALRVNLTELVIPDRGENSFHLIREESATLLTNPDESCRIQIISNLDMIEEMELYLVRLKPRGQLRSAPHPARTEEIATTLRGQIEVIAGERRAVIKSYDSVHYRADVEHCIRNLTNRPALVYLAVRFRKD